MSRTRHWVLAIGATLVLSVAVGGAVAGAAGPATPARPARTTGHTRREQPGSAALPRTAGGAHPIEGWSKTRRFLVAAVVMLIAVWVFDGAPMSASANHRLARTSLYELPPDPSRRVPERAHPVRPPPLR